MRGTVREIFQKAFAGYRRQRRLPMYLHRAARALMRCRTAALGGHAEVCPEGHVNRVWYNSCRHRSCPQCSFAKLEEWLERKRQLLLNSDHYQVVFTLPHELLPLWRWNRKAMADLLFCSARHTLFTLLGDPQYLGAMPGVLMALHTWSRTLLLHPHVHCLITGWGLTAAGVWKRVCRPDILLPAGVVRAFFMKVVTRELLKLLDRGELELPPNLDLVKARRLVNKTRQKNWNVLVGQRYSYGEGLATYLARYMKGGPLKNSRIVSFDDTSVTFRYYEVGQSKSAAPRTMCLAMDEFLSRLLEHVPPPGSHVIRSYGLYHSRHRALLEACRSQLPETAPTRRRRDPVPEFDRPRDERCRTCGRPLSRQVIPRGGAPPMGSGVAVA